MYLMGTPYLLTDSINDIWFYKRQYRLYQQGFFIFKLYKISLLI